MDVNTLRIIVTVASFLVFIGIVAFAIHPGNRQRFHEAAHVPLNDGDDSTLSPTRSQGRGSERGKRFHAGRHQ